MKKTGKNNFILQGGVLDLGRLLARHYWVASAGQAVEGVPSTDDVSAKTESLLRLVRSSPARAYFGIGADVTDEDAIRLRVIALLAWRVLGESQVYTVLADILHAVMCGKQNGGQNSVQDSGQVDLCRRLLHTRDCIGGMIGERFIISSPDSSGNRGAGLGLPLSTYGWLCGGSPQSGSRSEQNGSIPIGTSVPTARQLYESVRKKVIGCDPQIRTLASRISLAVARADVLANGERDNGVGNQVIVVFGASGTGKTFAVEEIARASNLNFASFDASGLSGSGWAGSSVDDALKLALSVAKGDSKRASRSIVCFDEIDKVLRGGQHEFRQATQADLLRPLGGHSVIIGGKRNFDGPPTNFDCGPTTFVLSGVFDGLLELADRRGNRTIGFQSVDGDKEHSDYRHALEEYGCIPELCNRISAFVMMPDPSADSIVLSVISEHGIVDGYNHVLAARDIVLSPKSDGVNLLADYGIESKTFFRGVKHILGTVVEDVLFNETKGTVKLDASLIRRAIDRAGGVAASAGDFDSVGTAEPVFNNDGVDGAQPQVELASC